ncbi:hypothetical protein KDD17_03975 [Sulfitobacter albidus]|uniref:Uncharacterized protein n=1 Tax=Sulfitobacter albidus TaxID=2829501 RepID=A0A975JET7_9RHOB|nr:hypothetical protein [Sulfitobacter albidus]QUJ77189.1 hypothetical protein KDD17_03975 [Sulfitobacter albidus]
MKFPIALGFVISLISTSVSAESIRWKPETLKPGDYTSINQSQGGLIHHVFRGKVGRFYVLDSYRGSSPSGKPVFSTYMDKDGNQVRWVRQDGFELKFRPHDCKRTLGRCQYTQTGSDGKKEVRLRITEATRNGFKFSEYGSDGKRLFGGNITLDARGNAGNGRLDGYQGKQRFRLVKQAYQ